MKLFKLFVCFYLLSIHLYSQESFPKSWEGNYKGELQIYGVDSVKMKLAMKLDIDRKTDSIYQWKMTYFFKGKEDIRNYELILKDSNKGHYVIDEKNSILIESYLRTNIFTSFFKVSNSFIISTYTKVNDNIVFEIISANEKEFVISGNQKKGEDTIPEVISFLINGRQKAVLSKQ